MRARTQTPAMAESIHLAVSDGIARVTLARPEVRNAFNAEMIEQLHESLYAHHGRRRRARGRARR